MVAGFRSSWSALKVVTLVGQDLFIDEVRVAVAVVGRVGVMGRVVQVVAVHHDAVLQVHVHRDETFVRLNLKIIIYFRMLQFARSPVREMALTHWLLLVYFFICLIVVAFHLSLFHVSFKTHFNQIYVRYFFQSDTYNLFFIEIGFL